MAPLGFTVGFARIYTGVHYVSDVLVGWGLGLFVGWILAMAVIRFFKNSSMHVFTADKPIHNPAD